MDAKLEAKLDALPTEPGVYLMKDRRGAIIYVQNSRSGTPTTGDLDRPCRRRIR